MNTTRIGDYIMFGLFLGGAVVLGGFIVAVTIGSHMINELAKQADDHIPCKPLQNNPRLRIPIPSNN